MTAERLRAAVIGLGQMGRHHVRVLHERDDVDLVVTADPAGDPAGHARGVPVVEDVEDVVAAGVDVCVVAAPTEHHEAVTAVLADGGVHALVEKPLAPDLPTGLRIVDAFDRAGLVGAVGHIERFNPALQALRARLEADELGEIFQIATRRQGPFPARIRDVGVVLDLATHDVDLSAWVAGAPYVDVAAQTAHRTGRVHEDLVAVVGRLDSGAVANHLVNWLTPMKERVTVVTGEKGCFVADTLTADLTFFANGNVPTEWSTVSQLRGPSEGDMTRYAIPKPEPLATEIDAFLDAVRSGDRSRTVSMAEGLTAVRVASAILESARTRTVVAVGDDRRS